MTGLSVGFTFEPVVLVGAFVVALGVSLLSAYFPARRAARLQVVQSLQYE